MFGEKSKPPQMWGRNVDLMHRLDAAGILPEEIDHLIRKNYNCSYDDLMWSIWLEGRGDSLISNYVSNQIMNIANATTFSAWLDCNWNDLPSNWVVAWDNFYEDFEGDCPSHILT